MGHGTAMGPAPDTRPAFRINQSRETRGLHPPSGTSWARDRGTPGRRYVDSRGLRVEDPSRGSRDLEPGDPDGEPRSEGASRGDGTASPGSHAIPVRGDRGDVPFGVYYADALTAAQRDWCAEQPYLVSDALEEFQLIGFDQWDGKKWNGDADFEASGNYRSGCAVAWYRHQHSSASVDAPAFPFGTLPYRLALPDKSIGATNASDWDQAVKAFDATHVMTGTYLPDDSPLRTWPGEGVAPGSFVAEIAQQYDYIFGALLVFTEPLSGSTPEEALSWWDAHGAKRFYVTTKPDPDDGFTIKRVDLPIGPAVMLLQRQGSEPTDVAHDVRDPA